LIEDNPDNLELMRYLLKAFGHFPLIAQDGAEGLELARREAPDLIVCDIQLPKMNGLQVAQALKTDRLLTQIPCIAVTALAMVGDRERILAAGFDSYVAKPIVPEAFLKQVESFLPRGALAERPAPKPAPVSAPPPRAASNGLRILVVDNTPTNIDLARSTFEPLGYEVMQASNSADALTLARRSFPDLILSDIHMPMATGFNLFAEVKADPVLQNIPFVFISASELLIDNVRQKCMDMGADRFIARPVDPHRLISEVEEILGKHRRASRVTNSS
jgi:two-component system cell cycle response regulator